jgi:hypothetical protein
MLLGIVVLMMSAFATFYFRRNYEQRKKIPTKKNVLKIIQNIFYKKRLDNTLSESEVENFLAEKLSLFFDKVQTQYRIGKNKHYSERVDIDLGDGRLGIEIKLAKFLKKSNERNRLLGQVDLYKERKYKPENILILLVGVAELERDDSIMEVKKILDDKGVSFFYLKTI